MAAALGLEGDARQRHADLSRATQDDIEPAQCPRRWRENDIQPAQRIGNSNRPVVGFDS
jgi:hypothetical protein